MTKAGRENRNDKDPTEEAASNMILRKVSEETISTAITPHYFRHRFLTECGKANVPIVDSMAISGIKDISVVVKHYSHSTEEGQAKVFEVTRF